MILGTLKPRNEITWVTGKGDDTMIRLNNLSLLSLAGAVLILLLQAIASLTGKDFAWEELRFVDMLDRWCSIWLDDVALLNLDSMADSFLNVPVYQFLFFLAAALFVIRNLFQKQ